MRLSIETYVFREHFGDNVAIKMIKDAGFDAFDYSMFWATEKNDMLGDDYRERALALRGYADEIGIENTIVIFNLFHGTQISFPNRLFSKEHTHKAIIKEYDGKNVPQLAQKYNYSERSIWRILKSDK